MIIYFEYSLKKPFNNIVTQYLMHTNKEEKELFRKLKIIIIISNRKIIKALIR